MNEERTIGIGGLLIMALLVGGVCGWLLKPNPPCPCEQASSVLEYRVDTVTQIVARPPLVIRTRATDTVYRDTGRTFTTPAFEATLDTIVGRDTLGVTFEWPQYTFGVALRRAADSIRVEHRTLTITNTVVERRALWLDVLTHVGAAAVGYAVGANR